MANNAGRGRSAKIPVWFHVITAGQGVENGEVPDSWIRDQMKVLDKAFAGMTGGAFTGFTFDLAGAGIGSAMEAAAKAALRRGGPETLNIYSTYGGCAGEPSTQTASSSRGPGATARAVALLRSPVPSKSTGSSFPA